jgi:hypothetical protein
MMIDRKIFFSRWRESFGPLNQGHAGTLNLFLDHWDASGLSDLRWLAYIMATAHGEVGAGLQPVREGFAASDTAARHHVARLKAAGRITVNYARPHAVTGQSYYGRGFVQLTHYSNYEAMGQILGLDLVHNPDLALRPEVAVAILFTGMERGTFTRKTLADYFPPGGPADWIKARRIVNGTDRARTFAALGQTYHKALLEAAARPAETGTQPPRPAPPQPPQPKTPETAVAPREGLLAAFIDFIISLFNRKGP